MFFKVVCDSVHRMMHVSPHVMDKGVCVSQHVMDKGVCVSQLALGKGVSVSGSEGCLLLGLEVYTCLETHPLGRHPPSAEMTT